MDDSDNLDDNATSANSTAAYNCAAQYSRTTLRIKLQPVFRCSSPGSLNTGVGTDATVTAYGIVMVLLPENTQNNIGLQAVVSSRVRIVGPALHDNVQ